MVDPMWLLSRALRIVFPPLCAGCDRRCEELGFCARCRSEIERTGSSTCPGCGREFRSGSPHECATCIDDPPAFARVVACGAYSRLQPNAPLLRAIRRLKYDRDVTCARPLADMLVAEFDRDFVYDAVVPVPLHLTRLRWRGFNQAVLIARSLALHHQCPLERFALERTRATDPQVGLSGEARKRNVAGAFRLRPGWEARGKRILLVDDVFTTGATVRECASILLGAGAQRVEVAVVARAE